MNGWVLGMSTVDLVIKSSRRFYRDLKSDENSRYRSWEHCYSCFMRARNNKKDADNDYLSLQLAFYLASWGMYRGSSFLLQKDYKVHIPAVEELMKGEYDVLAGIQCTDFNNECNRNLLERIYLLLEDHYGRVRCEVRNAENAPSSILITKILLGTLGCVPAYDQYFTAGIRDQRVATCKYSTRSIMQLVGFYEENAAQLKSVRSEMWVGTLKYPQMKLLDMGFWQLGVDLKQGNRDANQE